MDTIIYPFPLPIYQDFIDKESFDIIDKDVNNFIKKHKSSFRTLWNCPTLTTNLQPNEININSKTLKFEIKKHTENYFKHWGFNKIFNLKLHETWVNIASKGGYQEEHNHAHSLFSGVLYINVNKISGNFQFINPLSSESILMKSPPNFDFDYTITPKNSMILIFPGWLNHRVLPNNSNEDRISISFNIDEF